MPPFSAEPIEPRRKGALDPLHAGDQIGLRGLNGQVVMVDHYDIRIEPPAATRHYFKERGLKSLSGFPI